MRAAPLLLAALALAGCQQAKTEGNASLAENMTEKPTNQCTPPMLALANGAQLASQPMEETNAHFADAYESACAKGLLKDKPLIDPKAADQGKLFLINAPDANVASIYLSEVDANKMLLEYPFLTADGKTQVPSTEELGEAIYCAVHGATPEEQESAGRCLAD